MLSSKVWYIIVALFTEILAMIICGLLISVTITLLIGIAMLITGLLYFFAVTQEEKFFDSQRYNAIKFQRFTDYHQKTFNILQNKDLCKEKIF